MFDKNKIIWMIICAVLLMPVCIVAGDVELDSVWLKHSIFGFVLRVSEQTRFVGIANAVLVTFLISIPIQLSLVTWLACNVDFSEQSELLDWFKKNIPTIRVGRFFVIQIRYGFGAACLAIMALIIFTMFYVGGDLLACPGCETGDALNFLIINLLKMMTFTVMSLCLALWVKVLVQLRRNGNVHN